jgi:hypothetical protein
MSSRVQAAAASGMGFCTPTGLVLQVVIPIHVARWYEYDLV